MPQNLNLIPTVADDATHARYVANIIAKYREATPDQAARGRAWYPTARQLAAMMAEGNVRAGAGVIAALSPQKAWAYNVRLAGQAFETGEVRGHVKDACGKAERIMLGADPLDVLPADSKTWNFFRCIVDPEDAEAVVIDRHAHDIAVGVVYGDADRGLGAKRRYATLSHAYREAARQLGEIPSVVQAVSWVVQVERER
ncbi:MAG: hypothetical protein JWO67_3834 [Streptosporangiaceae bacterium]|nr:hypothetical protein [Streptosporangiaceae bacterium]